MTAYNMCYGHIEYQAKIHFRSIHLIHLLNLGGNAVRVVTGRIAPDERL